MMLGIPGAGKTSIAEHIAAITRAVHINSDQFRKRMFDNPETISETEHGQIYAMLDYVTEQILASGKSVIYDANINQYIHRREKYAICQKTGARPQLIWVKTDINVARRRATREAKLHPTHRPFGNMSQATFDRLVKQVQQPRPGEKAVEISGDTIQKSAIKSAIS